MLQVAKMRASNTRIMIIGQVQGCIGYENILRRNNFNNIHACMDGISGLQKMEHESPQILIIDAEMPDMDGFELATHVREIERSENRFTYIVLIAKEKIHNKIEYAWQANVDVIIPKDDVPFRLAPQVMSGERLAAQTNRLLTENASLKNRCGTLEAGQLLDPLTGLGNRRQAMRGMEDTIRQIEARGGVIALLLIKMMDLKELIEIHKQKIVNDLIIDIGKKIRRLVRPLDIVTYFDEGTFAVIMQHDNLKHCNEASYTRIWEGLALNNFQTRAGYVQPKISIGACGAGAEMGPPKISCLIDTAMDNLTFESSSGGLKATVLN